MFNSNLSYSFFSSFVIRTPSYPINFYLNLTKGLYIDRNEITKILNDEQFKNALFLASPDLYEQIDIWTKNEDYHIERTKKIEISLLKYIIRMSTRCTPFGLFSACGTGKLAPESSLNINADLNGFYERTRLNMQFLGTLASHFSSNSIVQNKLLLYPNTTLYKLAKTYRYIQYSEYEQKRVYSLEGFTWNKYLDKILKRAKHGVKVDQLISILTSKNISEIEAKEFIDELIVNQILIYEVELNLTGDDFLNRLTALMCGLKKSKDWFSEEFSDHNDLQKDENDNSILFLEKISNALIDINTESLDKNRFNLYEDLTKLIAANGFFFDKKYLFQTDLFLKNNDLLLSRKYTKDIAKAVLLLNKISEIPKKSFLENFKKAFIERYDTQTVPLVKALDPETGLGYIQNQTFDVTPLLDVIEINHKITGESKVYLSNVDHIILNKVQKSQRSDKNNVTLRSSDFESIDFSNENLPCTFSCLFEVIEENGKEWVSILNIGESSAANLSARFCYGNEQIDQDANEITTYEVNHFTNKIIAEIVHLPENRTGNVLRRPSFRPFEIPYVGQSSLPLSQQINIEDIMLKVENGRLILISKKHRKEIIPRHTNAHNYSYSSLPIYQFLHDMQFENCKPSLGLNHYIIDKMVDYLPRIIIENCIVSKEKWIFTKAKQHSIFKKFKEKNIIYEKSIFNVESDFLSYIPPLPQYVSLVDDDNTLTLNLENRTCIEILVETVKNRNHFILEEYLFPSKKLVNTTNQNYYGNQFIVGIKWKRK